MSADHPLNQTDDFQLTGERHIPVHNGADMSLANVDHMIRYAFVSPFVEGKRVLDISCGAGYGTQFMALQGASEVVGVDIDEESINFASKFYSHPRVNYLQSDAHYVRQLEDASFDVIVSFETIEHLPRPRQFLAELRRLLKPGGQLFVSCPNDYRVSPWLSQFHLHKFRFTEFRNLFLSVFGEGVFVGQHLVVSSCILKPIAPSAKASKFEAYQSELPDSFFCHQYLEHISAIENADGYLAILGVDESLITSQSSTSQNAFQMLMRVICAGEAAISQLDSLRQQLHHAEATREQATQMAIQAQERIKAMESSKFWQLRRFWMGLKRKVGLPVNE